MLNRYIIREVQDCVDEIGLADSKVFSTIMAYRVILQPIYCEIKIYQTLSQQTLLFLLLRPRTNIL